jgi:uncharacterized HAD superfamily protein
MSKETLALDIDDVVVKHVEGFIEWSNLNYGTDLTTDDYSEAWHEMWSIDQEETEARKKLFFTDEIVGAFEVIEGAGVGVTALAAVKRIVGVTARRDSLRHITEQVLEIVAPGAVEEVVFATYFKGGQKFTRSKADICLDLGATDLVDDHLKHCLAVSRVGVNAVLFGDYAWNRSELELPSNVTRARNWSEVLVNYGVVPPTQT